MCFVFGTRLPSAHGAFELHALVVWRWPRRTNPDPLSKHTVALNVPPRQALVAAEGLASAGRIQAFPYKAIGGLTRTGARRNPTGNTTLRLCRGPGGEARVL